MNSPHDAKPKCQCGKANYSQHSMCTKCNNKQIRGKVSTCQLLVPQTSKLENLLDPRGSTMMPQPWLHIYLCPHVTLTFDLLTPKVDRFMPQPRGTLVPIASTLVLSKFCVHKFGNGVTLVQQRDKVSQCLTALSAQKGYIMPCEN